LEAVYHTGVSAHEQHKLPEARRALQEVVDIDPDYKDAAQTLGAIKQHLEAVYHTGVSAYEQHKLPEARRALQEVVDIDPDYKDAAQTLSAIKQHLEAVYHTGVSAYEQHKLPEARRALQEVVDIDPDYKDAARLLAQVVKKNEKRRKVRRIVLASVVVIIVALVTTTVVWPRVSLLLSSAAPSPTPRINLSDARVGFSITLGNRKIPVPVSNTITLAPGDVVLIETSVTTDSSPFPRALSFQYYAPRGRVASKVSGPRTSYVAPARPGPDVITVSVTDQATGASIQRHINIIVKEKE